MTFEHLLQSDSPSGVRTITLDRPDRLNAVNATLAAELPRAVDSAAVDDAVRVIVITGAGRGFCSGLDISEPPRLPEHSRAERLDPLAWVGRWVLSLARCEKPVVAAVNGVAAGAGAAFAFACDLRVVGASAGFNLAFSAIALSCDSGSSWSLPRLVGPGVAKDLLFFPRTVHAEEALSLGLATRVVPDDELAGTAHDLATRLAAGPTMAYTAIREAVAFSQTHDLAQSLAHEAELMGRTGRSQDHAGAVRAFLAKETPTFHGV